MCGCCVDKFYNTLGFFRPDDMYGKANGVLYKYQEIDTQTTQEPSNV